MKNNKVVLDFTQTNSPIDVAVMPAGIAKRALQALSRECDSVHQDSIMQNHQEILITHRRNEDYNSFVNASAEFVQERTLMDNLKAGNWDAYKVETE